MRVTGPTRVGTFTGNTYLALRQDGRWMVDADIQLSPETIVVRLDEREICRFDRAEFRAWLDDISEANTLKTDSVTWTRWGSEIRLFIPHDRFHPKPRTFWVTEDSIRDFSALL